MTLRSTPVRTRTPSAEYREVGRSGVAITWSLRRALACLATLLLLLLVVGGLGARPAAAIENTWTAHAADIPGAAELAGGGRGVTVAVLDSWVDSRHPDFQGHVLGGATCDRSSC